MANIDFINAKNVRIYKDGVYIGTATAVSSDSNQETTERNYIGDDETVTITGIKTFGGSLTRDLTDEGFLEHIIGSSVSSKFAATNYEDDPDDVKGTVDSGTDVDSTSFTTPNKANLQVQSITFNGVKNNAFEGGLELELWEGLAGSGTLKGTASVAAGTLPTNSNEFVTAYLTPESGEFTVTSNTSHQLRLTAAGAPTGSFDVYGPTAAADFYFAIEYETSVVAVSDYVIDIVMQDTDGNEVAVIRDTGVTFLNDNLSMSGNEPISEATGWTAKSRTIL